MKKIAVVISLILVAFLIGAGILLHKDKSIRLSDETLIEKKETGSEQVIVDERVKNGGNGDFGVLLVSQEGNNFRIRLSIQNKKQERSLVKYIVALYRADQNGEMLGESLMDLYRYDDLIALGSGSEKTINKEIRYSAPNNLKGKFSIVVKYWGESGGIDESAIISGIELNGSQGDNLEILSETCELRIAGEEPSRVYANGFGIDVRQEEGLTVKCQVKNHSNTIKAAKIGFSNYLVSHEFGPIVEQESGNGPSFVFSAGTSTTINVPVAKAKKPQAYDAEMYLINDAGNRISNAAYFHYVISGESARVIELGLDKDNYMAGDTAIVKMLYGGSADSFEAARSGGTKNKELLAEIDIRDHSDKECLKEKSTTKLETGDGFKKEILVGIVQDCDKPYIDVVLKGERGVYLFEKTFLRE